MRVGVRRWARAIGLGLMATSLAVMGTVSVGAQSASADSAPAAGTPATVTADALPTWQLNGVVWSETVVGNTVYATGAFTKARPPGVAPGGAGEIDAANIFAFDIRTGQPVANFSHALDAQGLVIKASPDGSRVYVGGDFTTVDGVVRNHIAAFDTATGALLTTFKGAVGGQVRAIAATNTTVYVGGQFFSSSGVTRTRLAAFNAATGALLPWAPSADDGKVWSMVMTPDSSRVIVGGSFTTLNTQAAYGSGSLDAATGATMPWAANQVLRDAGDNGAILGLTTDGTQIYGSGYSFGSGAVWEGTWSADPYTGTIRWLNDCHGDTYDTVPIGQVLYEVGHTHDCSPVGEFADTNPRVHFEHALAWTTYPTGTNTGPDTYGWNYSGYADSTMLHWYPNLTVGTYTGQSQAAWSVAGNDTYVVLGGEFPTVNGTPQQGLVRFAVASAAPDKVAPLVTSDNTPSGVSLSSGRIRVSWKAATDNDNRTLTYAVQRDHGPIVYETNQDSKPWDTPIMGFVDKGLDPGSTHTYSVQVTDPLGNTRSTQDSSPVTVSSNALSTYAQDVLGDGASSYWRLGESSGTAVYDWAGFADGTTQSGVSRGTAGAITGDTNLASTFNGTSSGYLSTGTASAPRNTFTVEAWVKSTTKQGGRIVGFSNKSSGTSSSTDRHIYMDNSGHVLFGVNPGAVKTVASSRTYNDGNWHYVAATLSSAGMVLYVDGLRVARDQSTTTAQSYQGYWRIGGDSLTGWPSKPSSSYFNGAIDDVALYPSALSATTIQRHYLDSGRTLSGPNAPADTYGKAVYNADPDLYWRLNETSISSTVNDATRLGNGGSYSGIVTKSVAGAIVGSSDTAVTFNGSTGIAYASSAVTNPRVYSEELWFKTTTTRGGKLIGFGDRQTGSSTTYDRHVWMLNTGQLRFGVNPGQQNVVESPASYNDGKWHHLVAAQGPDGMHLYVDGAQVGSNPQTGAASFTGYWRIGGDVTWGGNTSNYFAGSIDEVAVYGWELSATDALNHYRIGIGTPPNQPPNPAFTSSTRYLQGSFDASGSTDTDGTIASYSWNFGDGSASATGVSTTHTYAQAGTYTVTLTVTDNSGATATVTHDVSVTANVAPVAEYTSSASYLKASFDGSTSSDSDGSVLSYSWDFGDGSASATGVSTTHTYAGAGTYSVTLTVTDDQGATATVTHGVTVKANVAPSAAFGWSSDALVASFDGSASSDFDGSLASYSWDFGDGSPTDGAKSPTHTYPKAGLYTVTLTVTDDQGATSAVSHDVIISTVAAPLAADAFTRTTTGGWGSADVGGSWTRSGTATNYAVTGGRGQITLSAPGNGPTAYLGTPSALDVDGVVDVSVDKAATGGPVYTSLSVRRSAAGEYFAQVRWAVGGQVYLDLVRSVGGVQTNLKSVVVNGLTAAPGDVLRVRLQAAGANPTTLNAKVWRAGSAEPAGWQVTASDGTAGLQDPAGVGVRAYLAGAATNAPVVASFDNLQVYRGTAPPANQPPKAALNATSTGLDATFDGSASSDADGVLTTYDWDFGDGSATGHGVLPVHSYSAPGSYTVKLTVTDDRGATDTATQQLYVSAGSAVPRPEHVVIVELANHSESSIIGNSDAPFLNSLATSGAHLTQAFGESSAGQPNYLALFSGSTQGVQDDSCPHSFATRSLYDQLAAAGLTFTGYSESLPSAGFSGCSDGDYSRLHSPWVNWPSVPDSSNQPFAAFPGDFATLPAVSWVTPNLQHDMQNGSVAQGDAWLAANIGPYAAWANTHNSLLIVTFDQDGNAGNNQVPTLITGERVRAGAYSETVNHYALLRTIEDAFGIGSLGAGASTAPIADVWTAGRNQAPTASFTWSTDALTATFDGTASTDPDGTVASYSWDFGDGTAPVSCGRPQHQYVGTGVYPVTLTVTDDKGLSASVSHDVTVTAGQPPIALDAFGRTLSGGWGTADTGGLWTRSGTATNFSVDGSAGQIKMTSPGNGPAIYLNSVSARDIDGKVDITVDKAATGGSIYTSMSARRTDGGEYLAQVRWTVGGAVYVDLVKTVGGVQTAMQSTRVSGLSAGPGDALRLRFSVTGSGPTSLKAKVWRVGNTEPVDWQVSATDSTDALQGPGAVGLRVYLAGTATNAPVVASFRDFKVS